MRNIICINSLIFITGIALPLQAEPAAPKGCYERQYSQEHLAKNRDQVVGQIVVKFGKAGNDVIAQMRVLTADQGHVRQAGNGGRAFAQYLYCFAPQDGDKNWTCSVECDGGSMNISRSDDKTLLFSTSYLLVGEEDQCGGPVDLAEKIDQKVTYKLNRVADSQCIID